MIEIKHDRQNNHQEETGPQNMKIIAIGGTGTAILDRMTLDQLGEIESSMMIDTDQQSYMGTVCENKILLGRNQIFGMGVNGDGQLGKEVAHAERDLLYAHLQGVDLALILTGFGGGTGTGVTEEVIDILKEMNSKIVVIGVTPFQFESKSRQQQARQVIKRVRSRVDSMLLFSNQRLLSVAERNHHGRDVFTVMNRVLAGVCGSIANSLYSQEATHMKLEDLVYLSGECEGLSGELENCWVGHGFAEGENFEEEVVNMVFDSPLFDDRVVWEKGDRAVASIVGGEDMSVKQFQMVIELLKKQMPVEMPLISSTSVDSDMQGQLTVTLFIGRSGEEFVIDEPMEEQNVQDVEIVPTMTTEVSKDLFAAPAPMVEESEAFAAQMVQEVVAVTKEGAAVEDDHLQGQRSRLARPKRREQQTYFRHEQEELPFDSKALLGRFEKASPTVMNGQNLDTPTFMRMKIRLRG
jgi:cell division protein FtsZ